MRPPLSPPSLATWTMSDGYAIRGRVWPLPDRPARKRIGVIYLHGIQSHGGWFEYSASWLSHCGVAVLLADRRGSGLNDAARGDVPTAERWLADVDELARAFAQQFQLDQLGVVGVSWGGKLALAWLVQRPPGVTHALLVAPGVCAAVDVALATKLRIALSLVTNPSAEFQIPLDDAALFTSNPIAQEFIRRDPLKLARVTARFLFESRRLDVRLHRSQSGAVQQFTEICLAGVERIIDNRRTIKEVQRLVANTGAVHHFPTSAHTLEFETDPESYLKTLAAWVAEIEGNPIETKACNTSNKR